jgi:hypothetical protein
MRMPRKLFWIFDEKNSPECIDAELHMFSGRLTMNPVPLKIIAENLVKIATSFLQVFFLAPLEFIISGLSTWLRQGSRQRRILGPGAHFTRLLENLESTSLSPRAFEDPSLYENKCPGKKKNKIILDCQN